MHIVKLLSFVFLALYLVIVGLEDFGVHAAFIHPHILGFIAVVAGILFFYRGIKSYYCCCGKCDHHHHDHHDRLDDRPLDRPLDKTYEKPVDKV